MFWAEALSQPHSRGEIGATSEGMMPLTTTRLRRLTFTVSSFSFKGRRAAFRSPYPIFKTQVIRTFLSLWDFGS